GMVNAERNWALAVQNENEANRAADAERSAKELALTRLRYVERSDELLDVFFADIDPLGEQMGGVPIREQWSRKLDQLATQLNVEVLGDALRVARMQNTLGRNLALQGQPEKALNYLAEAYRTRASLLGPDHPDTLWSLSFQADAYRRAAQPERAVPL